MNLMFLNRLLFQAHQQKLLRKEHLKAEGFEASMPKNMNIAERSRLFGLLREKFGAVYTMFSAESAKARIPRRFIVGGKSAYEAAAYLNEQFGVRAVLYFNAMPVTMGGEYTFANLYRMAVRKDYYMRLNDRTGQFECMPAPTDLPGTGEEDEEDALPVPSKIADDPDPSAEKPPLLGADYFSLEKRVADLYTSGPKSPFPGGKTTMQAERMRKAAIENFVETMRGRLFLKNIRVPIHVLQRIAAEWVEIHKTAATMGEVLTSPSTGREIDRKLAGIKMTCVYHDEVQFADPSAERDWLVAAKPAPPKVSIDRWPGYIVQRGEYAHAHNHDHPLQRVAPLPFSNQEYAK